LRNDPGEIAEKLKRHGVHINPVAVNDTSRRLIRPAITNPTGKVATSIRSLDTTLNQLGTKLGALPIQRHG
jgi:hypothetical protein